MRGTIAWPLCLSLSFVLSGAVTQVPDKSPTAPSQFTQVKSVRKRGSGFCGCSACHRGRTLTQLQAMNPNMIQVWCYDRPEA